VEGKMTLMHENMVSDRKLQVPVCHLVGAALDKPPRFVSTHTAWSLRYFIAGLFSSPRKEETLTRHLRLP
jgi:hypothetical protein